MFISGGENVYPAEVENIFYQMDEISEVAVIGVSDSKWGEVGCAVIVTAEGETIDMSTLSKFVQGKLARFKQPAHLVFVDALPRTASGKLLKFELKKDMPPRLELR